MSLTCSWIICKIIVSNLLFDSVFSIILESRQDFTGMDTLARLNIHLLVISDGNNLSVGLWISIGGSYTSTDAERFSSLEDSINTFFNGESGWSRESSGNSVGSGNALGELTFHGEILSDNSWEVVSEIAVGSIESARSGGQVRPHRGSGAQTGRVAILVLLCGTEVHIIGPAA